MSIVTCTTFFFFNDTATTEIYTLSLHDALPISRLAQLVDALFATIPSGVGASRSDVKLGRRDLERVLSQGARWAVEQGYGDRKSTRLNSSHGYISYAVFCLKKKKELRRSAD